MALRAGRAVGASLGGVSEAHADNKAAHAATTSQRRIIRA
jgi:hypothetical protein